MLRSILRDIITDFGGMGLSTGKSYLSNVGDLLYQPCAGSFLSHLLTDGVDPCQMVRLRSRSIQKTNSYALLQPPEKEPPFESHDTSEKEDYETAMACVVSQPMDELLLDDKDVWRKMIMTMPQWDVTMRRVTLGLKHCHVCRTVRRRVASPLLCKTCWIIPQNTLFGLKVVSNVRHWSSIRRNGPR